MPRFKWLGPFKVPRRQYSYALNRARDSLFAIGVASASYSGVFAWKTTLNLDEIIIKRDYDWD